MPIENTNGLNDFERKTRERFSDRFDPIEPRTYLKIVGLAGALVLAGGITIGCAGKYAADYFGEIVLKNSQ